MHLAGHRSWQRPQSRKATGIRAHSASAALRCERALAARHRRLLAPPLAALIVSETGVYVSFACNRAYGFTPKCGKSLWHHGGSCFGGGGKNVALIDGEVYTRDHAGNLILDAQTGELNGTFGGDRIPASSAGNSYTLVDGKVWARSIGSAVVDWSFGGSLTIAPIVVGQHVVVGASDGTVSVLAATDGAVVSSYELNAAIAAPDEHNVSTLVGLGAANNRRYVPNGNRLTAF
jgi:hypothetical protein